MMSERTSIRAGEGKTFRWMPLDGGRHAIPGRTAPQNVPVTTLCSHSTTMPDHEATKREWLWPTCLTCYARARGYTHISLAKLPQGGWP